jgi:16S rRNA (adenine1518-N6/adenine1519-N6)-dimethyltransferase
MREIREELGVEATLTPVVKLPCSEQTGWEFIWLYRGEHEGPFTLARTEIEHGEFFPVEVVSGWIKARPEDFAPGFLDCWKAYLVGRDSVEPKGDAI